MKRKLTLILFFLISIFTLSGCSCAGETILNFSNNFSSTNAVQPGFKETLTYIVTYQKSNAYYQMADSLEDSDLSVTYDEGSYTQVLEVLSVLPADIESDIRQKTEGKVIYKLYTLFTIDLSYTLGTESSEATDFVETVVYFCNNDLSFAPIYSNLTSRNTFFFYAENGSLVNTVYSNYETLYNQNSFTVNGKTVREADGESAEETTAYTEDYTFRTIIDNSQLLFIARNFKVETESYPTIPVKNFNYQKATDLVFTNKTTNDTPVNIDFNGETLNSLSLIEHEFAVNDATASGMSQFYFISSAKGEPYDALMCKYIEPIIEFSSMRCTGSLIYDLVKVEK